MNRSGDQNLRHENEGRWASKDFTIPYFPANRKRGVRQRQNSRFTVILWKELEVGEFREFAGKIRDRQGIRGFPGSRGGRHEQPGEVFGIGGFLELGP